MNKKTKMSKRAKKWLIILLASLICFVLSLLTRNDEKVVWYTIIGFIMFIIVHRETNPEKWYPTKEELEMRIKYHGLYSSTPTTNSYTYGQNLNRNTSEGKVYVPDANLFRDNYGNYYNTKYVPTTPPVTIKQDKK